VCGVCVVCVCVCGVCVGVCVCVWCVCVCVYNHGVLFSMTAIFFPLPL